LEKTQARTKSFIAVNMLNLSQLARESHNYSKLEIIQSSLYPDIYLAQNLVDYQSNSRELKFPWYKSIIPNMLEDRAYIIFQNVGLKILVHEQVKFPNWFILHDDSGEELIYWNANHELFPATNSFRKAQQQSGLKNDDWVYDVFVRYLISKDLPSIVDVRKYKFSDKQPEKDSLVKRIRNFFPEFRPELQPAF